MFPIRKRRGSRQASTRIKIHTFKGILNGGTLVQPASGSAVTTWGGIYTVDMTNIPVYLSLGSSFEFARLNSLRFELLPRSNVNQTSNAATTQTSGTIVVGVDEIPMSSTSGNASTWTTATSEDSGVTEAHAQACVFATPDYIRAMEGCREVEIYKKIVKSLIPATYVATTLTGNSFNQGALGTLSWLPMKRKWFNTQVFSSSAQAQASPLFFGLMYAFSNANTGGSQIPIYDVRVHYSMSFKRVRGI